MSRTPNPSNALKSSLSSVVTGSNDAFEIQKSTSSMSNIRKGNADTTIPTVLNRQTTSNSSSSSSTPLTRAEIMSEIGGLLLEAHHPALLRLGNALRCLINAADVQQLVDVEAKTQVDEDLSSLTVNGVFVQVCKDILLQPIDRIRSQTTNMDKEQLVDRRARLLHFFLIDEISYVKSLKMIIDRFVNPFKALIMLMKRTSTINTTISTLELVDLFSNVEDLHEISNFSLWTTLSELRSVGCINLETELDGRILKFELIFDKVDTALEIFCNVWNRKSNLLRAYLLYLSNFRRSLKLVKFLRSHRQSFVDYVDTQSICLGKELFFNDLLLLPLLRFTQYYHFFHEISATFLENISISLQISNLGIETIFARSQLQKYSIHARMRVAYIQEKLFQGSISLVTAKRFFIKVGQLTKTYNNTAFKLSKDKVYTFFLFNDMLLYANQEGSVYKLKHVVDISRVTVVEHSDPDNLSFKIDGGSAKTLILKAPDLEAKENWMNTLIIFSELANQGGNKTLGVDLEETVIKGPKAKFVREVGAGWYKVLSSVGMVFYFQEKTGMTSLCPPSAQISDDNTPSIEGALPNELLGKKCKFDGCKRFALKFSGLGLTCVEHTSIPEEDPKENQADLTASSKFRNAFLISQPKILTKVATAPEHRRTMSEDRGKKLYTPRDSVPPPLLPEESDAVPHGETDTQSEEKDVKNDSGLPLIPSIPQERPIFRTPPLPNIPAFNPARMQDIIKRRMPPLSIAQSIDAESNRDRMIRSATPIVLRSAVPSVPPILPTQQRKSSAPDVLAVRSDVISTAPSKVTDVNSRKPPIPAREALREYLIARARMLPGMNEDKSSNMDSGIISVGKGTWIAMDDDKTTSQESQSVKMSKIKAAPIVPLKKISPSVNTSNQKMPPPLKPKASLSSTMTPKDSILLKPKPKPKDPPAKPVKTIPIEAAKEVVPNSVQHKKESVVVSGPGLSEIDSRVPDVPEFEEPGEMKQLYDAQTGEPTMWFIVSDGDGERYYWNEDTEESLWEMPPGLTLSL